MLVLILCCIVLSGLSILTASPQEIHHEQDDFVPQEFLSDMVKS